MRPVTARPYTGMFAAAAVLLPGLGIPSLQTCEGFGVPYCPETMCGRYVGLQKGTGELLCLPGQGHCTPAALSAVQVTMSASISAWRAVTGI